jgi:hypothetical protein
MGKASGNRILLLDKPQAHIQRKRTFYDVVFSVLTISFLALAVLLFRMEVSYVTLMYLGY